MTLNQLARTREIRVPQVMYKIYQWTLLYTELLGLRFQCHVR